MKEVRSKMEKTIEIGGCEEWFKPNSLRLIIKTGDKEERIFASPEALKDTLKKKMQEGYELLTRGKLEIIYNQNDS